MEGTGVHVEWLYQIRFQENGKAYIKTVVNPYNMQQELLKRMGYTIDGESVTLYDQDNVLKTVTNTISDMGEFDQDKPICIGEQLYYDVNGDKPRVVFVPGLKFATSPMPYYDDMPDLSAPFAIDDNGNYTIGEITVHDNSAE